MIRRNKQIQHTLDTLCVIWNRGINHKLILTLYSMSYFANF